MGAELRGPRAAGHGRGWRSRPQKQSPGRRSSGPGDFPRAWFRSGLEVAVVHFVAGADEASVPAPPPDQPGAGVALGAIEDVVTGIAVQEVPAGPAVDVVVAVTAGDEFVPLVTADGVVAAFAEDPVVAFTAPDVVGAAATADDVVAAPAVDRVVPAAPDDHVRVVRADDDHRATLVRRIPSGLREMPVAGPAERLARWSGHDAETRDVRRGGQNDHDTAATAPQPDATCHVCLLVRGRGSWVAAASGPDNRDQRRTVHHRQHTSSSPH